MEEEPRQRAPADRTVRVGLADYAVGGPDPTLRFATSGLGSCVAVAIFVPEGVGALLHAMLPEAPAGTTDSPAKYVDTGIDAAIAAVRDRADRAPTVAAKVAGGSSMLDFQHGPQIGAENVAAARRVLDERGVDVLASETGGDTGRTVRFVPGTGDLTVDRADRPTTTI